MKTSGLGNFPLKFPDQKITKQTDPNNKFENVLGSFIKGVNTDQIFEVFAVANIVGGSICVPHTRRAVEFWEELA